MARRRVDDDLVRSLREVSTAVPGRNGKEIRCRSRWSAAEIEGGSRGGHFPNHAGGQLSRNDYPPVGRATAGCSDHRGIISFRCAIAHGPGSDVYRRLDHDLVRSLREVSTAVPGRNGKEIRCRSRWSAAEIESGSRGGHFPNHAGGQLSRNDYPPVGRATAGCSDHRGIISFRCAIAHGPGSDVYRRLDHDLVRSLREVSTAVPGRNGKEIRCRSRWSAAEIEGGSRCGRFPNHADGQLSRNDYPPVGRAAAGCSDHRGIMSFHYAIGHDVGSDVYRRLDHDLVRSLREVSTAVPGRNGKGIRCRSRWSAAEIERGSRRGCFPNHAGGQLSRNDYPPVGRATAGCSNHRGIMSFRYAIGHDPGSDVYGRLDDDLVRSLGEVSTAVPGRNGKAIRCRSRWNAAEIERGSRRGCFPNHAGGQLSRNDYPPVGRATAGCSNHRGIMSFRYAIGQGLVSDLEHRCVALRHKHDRQSGGEQTTLHPSYTAMKNRDSEQIAQVLRPYRVLSPLFGVQDRVQIPLWL